MRIKGIISALILSVLPGSALAAPPPTFGDAMVRFNTFAVNARALFDNVIGDGSLNSFVQTEWTVIAIALIGVAAAKYVFTDLGM